MDIITSSILSNNDSNEENYGIHSLQKSFFKDKALSSLNMKEDIIEIQKKIESSENRFSSKMIDSRKILIENLEC